MAPVVRAVERNQLPQALRREISYCEWRKAETSAALPCSHRRRRPRLRQRLGQKHARDDGISGEMPEEKGSSAKKVFSATAEVPGSRAVTRSMKTKGSRWGSTEFHGASRQLTCGRAASD